MDAAHTAGSREPHLLNLKVMRLSHPTLGKHAYPFALEPSKNGSEGVSDELRSALSSQRPSQALSMAQGDSRATGDGMILPSVQDLTLTPMLTLPSSFGSINLGETFNAILCLSNDAAIPVASARLVVNMQVANSTTVVGELGPPSQPDGTAGLVEPGANLELMISCEMRELGLHVLQCQVEYATSSGTRQFSRSYRFNVTAPLNIKTKTHLPTAVNALLSPSQRDLVFLEIHMQNVSTNPMVFERVDLVPVPGMRVVNRRAPVQRGRSRSAEEVVETFKSTDTSLIEGLFESLAPGDTRQHLFTLAPVARPPFPNSSLFPAAPASGSVVPLGRLDLAWRGPFGERGQLLTSMLSRRVPQTALNPSIAPTRTASALAAQPQQRPQSPFAITGPPTPPPKGSSVDTSAYDVHVSVIHCERHSVPLRKELKIKLRLAVGRSTGTNEGANLPPQLAVQYLRVVPQKPPPPPPSPGYVSSPISPPSRSGTPMQGYQVSVHPPSRSSTPTISRVPTPSHLPRFPSASSIRTQALTPAANMVSPSADVTPPPSQFPPAPILQLPASQLMTEAKFSGEVKQQGASLLFLPHITLRHLDIAKPQRDESPRPSLDGGDPLAPPPPPARAVNRLEGFVDFEIAVVATRPGLAKLGGLRVIRLNDWKDVKQGGEVLKELETLGDVWVEAW